MEKYELTDGDMAARLGVSRVTVLRYRLEQRVPKRAVMPKIGPATNGEVMPNDFFSPDVNDAAGESI